MNIMNSKFFHRNVRSNSCLINVDSIVNLVQNHRKLKPDLFGLPLPCELEVKQLSEENCCLLGLSMLNCWDPYINRPLWSYQLVDRRKQILFDKSAKSRRRGLKFVKVDGSTRGHCSSMRFGRNSWDSRQSCNPENIIGQTLRQNCVCCRTWEDAIEKRMDDEGFIGHITTVIDHRRKSEKNEHSM